MKKYDLREMVFAALFTALLCVCSFIRINPGFTPVPVTMQFFAVFLAGAMLSVRGSVMSVIVYIILGTVGLPVFSGMTSGPGVLAGPTGGYIIGFVAGVFAISGILEVIGRKREPKTIHYVLSMLVGMVVVYCLGTVQLMFLTRMNLAAALSAAVIPFVPVDCVKMALAVVAVKYLKPALKLSKNKSKLCIPK